MLLAIASVISVVVGWGLSSIQQYWDKERLLKLERWKQEQKREDDKWREAQQRINMFLEKRLGTYSEGLDLVYRVEMNQTSADVLDQIFDKWKEWYPLHVVYLPPAVNDDLFKAMNSVSLIRVDLGHVNRNQKTWDMFNERLQAAKTSLMNLKDIGWLPEGLR